MTRINRSALNRLGRTLLQFAVSAGFVELVLQRIADADLTASEQVFLTGAIQTVVAYLHRRYLDPSGLPSLVDGEGNAATAYQGQRVAGDGKGLT